MRRSDDWDGFGGAHAVAGSGGDETCNEITSALGKRRHCGPTDLLITRVNIMFKTRDPQRQRTAEASLTIPVLIVLKFYCWPIPVQFKYRVPCGCGLPSRDFYRNFSKYR